MEDDVLMGLVGLVFAPLPIDEVHRRWPEAMPQLDVQHPEMTARDDLRIGIRDGLLIAYHMGGRGGRVFNVKKWHPTVGTWVGVGRRFRTCPCDGGPCTDPGCDR